MIQIYAPHPDSEAILFLPKPEFGDGERPESRIQAKKAMNGDTYTHVTQGQPDAIHYRFAFNITRKKALELKEFIRLYAGSAWRIVWTGRPDIVANLMVNPLQLDMAFRGVVADSVEAVPIELEFESIQ